MTEYMRSSDAFTWSMESDPRLRSTVVTVLLLDRSPDWEAMRARFEAISAELPMFRQCVVESPLGAPPRWEPCPDFDPDFHMRRVGAAAPGTVDTVLEMARVAAMDDFDRARPLWEATLVEGLADGGPRWCAGSTTHSPTGSARSRSRGVCSISPRSRRPGRPPRSASTRRPAVRGGVSTWIRSGSGPGRRRPPSATW